MAAGWKDMIRTIAPAVARALGGPFASMVTKQLGDKLLGNPDATPADVEQAVLNATPEQLKIIKELDAKFATDMAELGIKLDEIEAGDRANAREREKVTHDPTTHILAYVVTGGFFGLVCLLATTHVPPENRDILMITVGIFGGAWTSCMAYYFGTTNQNKLKDAVVARVAERSRA